MMIAQGSSFLMPTVVGGQAQLSETDFDNLKVISELLCVQHHYMSLDMFSIIG